VPPLGSTFGLVNDFHYGRAWPQRTRVTDPLPGLGWTYPIEGNYAQRIVAVTFVLATDVNAANRAPRLSYQDAGGSEYAFAIGAAVQAASLTWRWCFTLGALGLAPANYLAAIGQLPPLFMQPGDKLVLVIPTAQVGDQVSKTIVTAEMFGTSQRDFPPGQGPELGQREWLRDQVAGVSREG
jgi:hypothetical protein